jgi:hypothetical protein
MIQVRRELVADVSLGNITSIICRAADWVTNFRLPSMQCTIVRFALESENSF